MKKRTWIIVALIAAVALTATPLVVYAGGGKNTNRGSEGEQIGEPTPDPAQDPQMPREGDPNPDEDNVPDKDGEG